MTFKASKYWSLMDKCLLSRYGGLAQHSLLPATIIRICLATTHPPACVMPHSPGVELISTGQDTRPTEPECGVCGQACCTCREAWHGSQRCRQAVQQQPGRQELSLVAKQLSFTRCDVCGAGVERTEVSSFLRSFPGFLCAFPAWTTPWWWV